MSRKTIMTVLGFISAILIFLKAQFDLAIDPAGFIAALGVVLLYVLFQGKMDIQKIGRQVEKFKSKKFWIGLTAVLIPGINVTFSLGLSPEVIAGIIAIAGVIMTAIFSKEFAKANGS